MEHGELEWRVEIRPDRDEPRFADVTVEARVPGDPEPLDIRINAPTPLAPPCVGAGGDGWSLRRFQVNVENVSGVVIALEAARHGGPVLGSARLLIDRDPDGEPVAQVIARSSE